MGVQERTQAAKQQGVRPIHEGLHTCGTFAGGGRHQMQRERRTLPARQDSHQDAAGQVVAGHELRQHDDAQPIQTGAQGCRAVSVYGLQVLELIAGATNLALMGLNARDGLRMAGHLRAGPTIASKGPAA